MAIKTYPVRKSSPEKVPRNLDLPGSYSRHILSGGAAVWVLVA